MGQYPWNNQVLTDWLKLKMAAGETLYKLSSDLQISCFVIQEWMTLSFPKITLSQIKLIADYRSWTLEHTAEWLDIKPAHMSEMLENSKKSSRAKVSKL